MRTRRLRAIDIQDSGLQWSEIAHANIISSTIQGDFIFIVGSISEYVRGLVPAKLKLSMERILCSVLVTLLHHKIHIAIIIVSSPKNIYSTFSFWFSYCDNINIV